MWKTIIIVRVAHGIVILASWLLHWFFILERLSLRPLRRSFLEFKSHYGPLRAILLVLIFPDVRNELDRIQRDILDPPVDDSIAAEKAMKLKESISERCTTLCSPAFDVVQLSLLALSLPNLLPVSWVSLIALVFSMTTSTVSVILAFTLRQHMDNLLEPHDVKKWFGRPADKQGIPADVDRQVCEDSPRGLKHKQAGEATYDMNCPDRVVRVRAPMESMRWKNVSFHAVLMMKIPAMLSVWSSGAFILGVGVYTMAHWALNLETPNFDRADSSQDGCSSLVILVAYNVAMVLGLLLVLVPSVLKYVQDAPLRQLDEATNPKKGQSKLDFESRFGDFEEYFKDPREIFKDIKECCRNFRDTFRYFDELYAEFEDIFWELTGEPGSSGTQAGEHSDILLNDSAMISGNTLTHENTQTQQSCQEESRQRNNIAKEATQSDVGEGGKPGTGYSSPEGGLGNSQGQALSSTYGINFKQPIPELMKRRMELMIKAQKRNITRLQLMLRKVETVLPKKGTMSLREKTALLREETALLREEKALLKEGTALLKEEAALLKGALLKEAALLKEETNRYKGTAVSASVCASEGSSLPHQES
ncbi:hypothetical protein MAA_08654 [Metarhizium robertsii ARSEF 23]|uniref:Uncharacterized protein n=1 Tax=Metarhizium robertsii (strain ARSEF 23 / ATCC MYA-3075) TaxID=655844 RepID=E9F8Q5_METRA|nr:uncharacterized protein MAA_08654 [Metarhizium robertsii ARSEF 23]EFY95846.2 hypothetical protein MAA_08654 [Metarhizium robertsii ARSEF 23]